MSVIRRVALALGLVFLLLLGAAELSLPRILNSETVREQVVALVEKALGRDAHYESVHHAYFPLALVVERPMLAGREPGTPPQVAAKRVSLYLSVLPLFRGQMVVRRCALDEPHFRITRTSEGIELAEALKIPDFPDPVGEEPAALSLQHLEIRSGSVMYEDLTDDPPFRIHLVDLSGHINGQRSDAPFDFEARARLASGGAVSAAGQFTRSGDVSAGATLESVDPAPFRPLLQEVWSFEGSRASGTLEFDLADGKPPRLGLDLVFDGGDVGVDRLVFRGPVAVAAELFWQGDGVVKGPVAVDATAARVAYGDAFVKHPGADATGTARVTIEPGVVAFDDVHLRIRNQVAEGSVRLGDSTRVEARIPEFDVDGLETSIPALEGYAISGPMSAELSIETRPRRVRGELRVDGVHVALADRGEIVLRGRAMGEGDTIRSDGLEIGIGDVSFPIYLVISGLGRKPHYRLGFQAVDTDANQWMSTFSTARDVLYGRFTIEADLTGSIDPGTPLLDGVSGPARAEILDGRLEGASLLHATFDRLGAVRTAGSAVADLGRFFRGEHVEELYSEEFQSIGGHFQFSDGRAHTDDLRFVYHNFTAELRGDIELSSLALDMNGSLTLGEQIDLALFNRLPLGSLLLGKDRTIPLAAVRGTLLEPRVEVHDDWIANMALAVARMPVDRALDAVRGAIALPSGGAPRKPEEP